MATFVNSLINIFFENYFHNLFKENMFKVKGILGFMLVFEYICRTSLSDFFVKYGSIRVLPVIFPCIQRIIGPEVFCKNSAFKNFAKFTGKHMCQGTFFNKLAK